MDDYIDDVRIRECRGVNNFYFSTKILQKSHMDEMADTLRIVSPNKELRYKSNPYNSDINEIKIYRHMKTYQPLRCKILDLYCCLKTDKSLRLCTDILLIDTGQVIRNVYYDHIFDFSQITSHCKDLEPEAKPAKLYLGDPSIYERYQNPRVDERFQELISGNCSEGFRVKIISRQSDFYWVDILLRNGASISTRINQIFSMELDHQRKAYWREKGVEDENHNDELLKKDINSFEKPTCLSDTKNGKTFQKRKMNLGRISVVDTVADRVAKDQPVQSPTPKFLGALNYFKTKLNPMHQSDCKSSRVARKFFKVKVISWYDPNTICIIPDDKLYYDSHRNFKNSIAKFSCVKNANRTNNYFYNQNKPYQLFDLVLFKSSSFDDHNLSQWLRGVVVACSLYDRNNLSVSARNIDLTKDPGILEKMVKDGIIAVDDIVYRVRSVDYGYECRSSHFSMRHLNEEGLKEFKSIGPWSLTCSLFGLFPLPSDRIGNMGSSDYSETCIGMMDSWLRERILDNGRSADFHVIFYSALNAMKTHEVFQKSTIYISLFHRYEPPYTLQDAYLTRQRRTHYQNLNWFLVESGLASDSQSIEDQSSHIQLEEHVINRLVKHNML